MSWWTKRTGSAAGQEMSISYIKNTSFSEMVKLFGKPHDSAVLPNNNMKEAIWKIDIFNIKYTFTMDSTDVALEISRDMSKKGMNKISVPIPDVSDPRVKEVEVKGNRQFADNIVLPLVGMLLKNKNDSNVMKTVMIYNFERNK